MAATLGSPWLEAYPVDFKSGGDTTREAFGKHIQEITRIYGILTDLDSGKVSADEVMTTINNTIGDATNKALNDHVHSNNPHPDWKINYSDLVGDIDATKVKGDLANATIDSTKVSNLKTFIQNNVPPQTHTGIEKILHINNELSTGRDGYIKFYNGLIITWGASGKTDGKYYFRYPFPNECYIVVAMAYIPEDSVVGDANYDTTFIRSWDKLGFNAAFMQGSAARRCTYIAIGD